MVQLVRITANGICVKAIYGIRIAMSRQAVCSKVHHRPWIVWIHRRHVNDHRQWIQVAVAVST